MPLLATVSHLAIQQLKLKTLTMPSVNGDAEQVGLSDSASGSISWYNYNGNPVDRIY